MTINIQSLKGHQTELENHLEKLCPHIVFLQETWLDESTEQIRINNYKTISRRDRASQPNRGGILTLARSDFNNLVHVSNSDKEERSWHFLNVGIENLLVGNWYRPGATEHDGFEGLQNEIVSMSSEISGIIICGDLNIHHSRWLRFSNGNTIQGSDLRSVCDNLGLLQLTREPTRQQYLLDLVLSDVAGARAKVGPYIADHKMVLEYFPVPEIQSKRIVRYGFSIKKTNWKELKRSLKEMDWQKLNKDTAEDVLNYFMEILWALLCTHIPFEEINL